MKTCFASRLLLVLTAAVAFGAPLGAEDVVIPAAKFKLDPPAELVQAGERGKVARVKIKEKHGELAVMRAEFSPGRYRGWYRLAAAPFAHRPVQGSVFVAAGGGYTSHSILYLNGGDFPPDGGFKDFPLEFTCWKADKPYLPISWANDNAPEELRCSQVRYERLDGGVAVVRVRPNKILYDPREKGELLVTLGNFTGAELEVTLRTTLTQESASVTGLEPLKVRVRLASDVLAEREKLPAKKPGPRQLSGEVTVSVPFVAPDREFGCEARVAAVVNDKESDANGDVFNVSRNVWRVGLGAPTTTIGGQSGEASDESNASDVEALRDSYSNLLEKMFWPPDDWGDMAPLRDEWISGQTARHENRARIRQFVRLAHEQGIKAITYGKHSAGGPSGFELYRVHPEWFLQDYRGRPVADFRPWDLRHWDDVAFHKAHAGEFPTRSWTGVMPDFRRADVLDWGIDNVIASAETFGWDGIRFDGHWSAGNDELSAWNARRMKERIWAKYPRFLFGFNYSWSFGKQTVSTAAGMVHGFDHELEENLAGGGLYVQEAIRDFGFEADGRYTSWRDFAVKEFAAANRLHALGASYHWVMGLGGMSCRDARYKLAVAGIVGAHPYFGDQALVRPRGWGRFLTRWSAMIYDPDLTSLPAGDAVKVTSARPVWGTGLAKQRVADAGTRQVVVHLLNPPPHDAIDPKSKDQLPGPARDVTVSVAVPDGQRLAHAVLLDPEGEPDAVPLRPEVGGRRASVTVPAVSLWAVVVFEFKGRFTPPAPGPKFARPPKEAEVAAGRRAAGVAQPVDPLRPGQPGGREGTIVASLWGNGVSITNVTDPDAKGVDHRVSRSDDSTKGRPNLHQTLINPPGAGRYRATYRLKLDNRKDVSIQCWGDTWSHKTEFFKKSLSAADFKRPRAYQDFAFEFEYLEEGHVYLHVQFSCPAGGNGLNCDTVTLECLEPYSEARLQEKRPAKAPADFAIGEGPGLKVLWVHGLLEEPYQIAKALKALPDVRLTERESDDWWRFPEKGKLDWAVLRKIDVVILANTEVPNSYVERLALADFVKKGGGLIVLGGSHSFARGAYHNTVLESLLPVSVGPAGDDLAPFDAPATLRPSLGNPLLTGITAGDWKANPALYWRHHVKPKPHAVVHLFADKEPVVLSSSPGSGRVVVFTAAPLGGPATDNNLRGVKIKTPFDGQTAFWSWAAWPRFMENVIRWAAGRCK